MTDMKFYNSEKFAYPCEDPLAIHAITECIEKVISCVALLPL